MKVLKKSLSVILSLLMVTSVFAGLGITAEAENEITTGTLVTFGSYPQSRVIDTDLLNSLNSQSLSWNYYDYYVNNAHEDFMQYADVTFSGERYRAVRFSHYRPIGIDGLLYTTSDTYQDDNGYEPNTLYWFKYDPIVWRVLDANTGLLMTESIIDSQSFNNGIFGRYYSDINRTHYISNWAFSSLRSWLNDDFYNTAFNSGTNCINSQPLKTLSGYKTDFDADPTTDKVYLLSREDVLNSSYGFISSPGSGWVTNRVAFGTEYAKCQGLKVISATTSDYIGSSNWLLRNPGDSTFVYYVYDGGYVDYYYWDDNAIETCYGIRPALNVDLQSAISDNIIKVIPEIETGTLVTFGSYPQSRVTDTTLLTSLNSQTLSWHYYDYYVNNTHEDFMEYADVTLSGEKYRAVRFSHYRPNVSYGSSECDADHSYQDDSGYNPGTVYWFRFEPIVWRVLDADAGLLMTDNIIDAQAFNNNYYSGYSDSAQTHYASNWAYSTLRTWMNSDLYNTAFGSEKSYIQSTSLTTSSSQSSNYDAGPTNDNVFLLTSSDTGNSAYGFSSNDSNEGRQTRKAFGTDYAKCQGLNVASPYSINAGASGWSLRDPYYNARNNTVSYDGLMYYISTYENSSGIRPVLSVDLESAITDNIVKLVSPPKIGPLVTFGSYPQTEVTDESLLSSLGALSLSWTYYDYYIGNEHVDFMEYADVTFAGNKYRAVRFSRYRPEHTAFSKSGLYDYYQDDNGYDPNTIYWFIYEPIVWRVLDVESGLLMTEKIIDSQPFRNQQFNGLYGDSTLSYYVSNWAYSSLRSWMNDDLYNTAFDSEKSYIQSTSLTSPSNNTSDYDADPTTDKVFLLSKADVRNTSYGFSSGTGPGETTNRIAFGTDYAKCQGLYVDSTTGNYYSGSSHWRLRTPCDNIFADTVSSFGDVFSDSTTYTYLGVRAALNVDLQSAVADGELQVLPDPENHTIHTPAETVIENEVASTCTAEGSYDEVVYCAECGEELSRVTKTVEQLDHSYTGEVRSNGNGQNATHSFKCVNGCNQYGGAVTHTWDDGVVTAAPSTTSTGTKTYTCTVSGCGATYTETLEALIPYAVFNEADGTLTFAVGTKTDAGVVRANGEIVSGDEYYTDFTNSAYTTNSTVPWYAVRENIVTVSFLDTISPISTRYWFYYFSALTEIEGLENLDTSNVTDMSCMFWGCKSLTSLDLSGFDTSNVTGMSYMFYCCNALTSLDVSEFDTSKVTAMHDMFSKCYALTSLDVSGFDTSNVTSMAEMFCDCSSLTTLDVSGFDTSKVTNMRYMFSHCYLLTTLDVSGFDTSNVTSMTDMFDDCRSLTTLDVSGFDTSNVTNMDHMFFSCSSLTTLDVSGFDTSKVTNMHCMFSACSKLTTLDVSGFDTSKVTDISWMFNDCRALTSLDVRGFDTSNVTDMSRLFFFCSKLTTLDVSGFDTSKVTNMYCMFYGCSTLTSLDVSGFDTSYVTDMSLMFCGCRALTSLDLSGFDTSNVTNMRNMFKDCLSLSSLSLGTDFAFVTSTQNGTEYNASLPDAPTDADHTGKWIRDNSDDAPLTAAELMATYDGATMAGTYIWECSHAQTETVRENETQATCTQAGGYTEITTCTICGKELSRETVTIPAGHNMQAFTANEPTCTADGNSAYWFCSKCEKYFSDADGDNHIAEGSWIIPATGHKTYVAGAWTWTPAADGYTATLAVNCAKGDDPRTLAANVVLAENVAAQHLVDGHKKYVATATIGTQTFTDEKTDTVTAEGHTTVHHDAVLSTKCTETGTVEYWSCTGCDMLFSDAGAQNVITDISDNTYGPHAYAFDSFVWSADGASAQAKYVCANNPEHTKLYTATVTPEVHEPTCTADGYTIYTAAYDGHTGTNRVAGEAATGHKTYVAGAWTWTPAADGYTASLAVNCAKGDDPRTLTANVVLAENVAAQHLVDGHKKYVATATIGTQTFTDEKTDTVTAEGHTTVHHDAVLSTKCTGTGTVEYWSCTGCDMLFSDAGAQNVITDISDNTYGPHAYAFDSFVWFADGASAQAKYVCANNPEHTKLYTATVTPEVHEPTCTADGYTIYTAAYDGHTGTNRVAGEAATGHKTYVAGAWTWTPAADGYTATLAVNCAKGDDPRTLTAVVELAEDVAAQHTVNGQKKYTATATIGAQTFTDEKTDVIAAEGHTTVHHDAVPAAKCTETGTIEYWSCTGCELLFSDAGAQNVITNISDNAYGPHDFSVLKSDGTYHWYECANEGCGAISGKAEHDYTVKGEEVTPATCGQNATAKYACVCGKTTVKEVPGTALEHDFSILKTDDTWHWYECANGCGEISGKAEHDYAGDGVVTSEPTCTAAGVRTFTCSGCDKTRTAPEPAKGHAPVKTEAVAATCTTAGNSAYWYCGRCSKYYSDAGCTQVIAQGSWVIPAIGHKWNDGEVTAEPTCTAKGQITYHCTRCDAEKTEEIGALEHVWDNGRITKNPTTKTPGEISFTCTRCGAIRTEVVKQLQGCKVCGSLHNKNIFDRILGLIHAIWYFILTFSRTF